MNNLFISAYPETSKLRQNELDRCLEANRALFDRVYVLSEVNKESFLNVLILPCTARPTFRTFFNAVNHVTQKDDVNVICNSDIYFKDLPILPQFHQCFALTRYDIVNGLPVFLGRSDSQDAWMFRGNVRLPAYCDFHMGVPGCDNRIALELSKAGYEVLNPSLTIKTYHLHSQPTDHNGKAAIHRPYLRPIPCYL